MSARNREIPSFMWSAADRMIFVANAALAALIAAFAARIDGAGIYLVAHFSIALFFLAIARLARDSRIFKLVHDWAPLLYLISTYFELGLLIPHVHPYGDYRFDRWLQAIDIWLLGDPAAFFGRAAWAPLSDFLTICYWSYYPAAVLLPMTLYLRGEFVAFQESVAIIVSAMLLTFVGYVLLPAVGPHWLFDASRLAALDGYGLARQGFSAMRHVPYEPPDAFPSGHALIGVLAPTLAWKYDRRLFAWLLPLGVGMVLSTLYLRFHYLADVAASLLLVPVAWALGMWMTRNEAADNK